MLRFNFNALCAENPRSNGGFFFLTKLVARLDLIAGGGEVTVAGGGAFLSTFGSKEKIVSLGLIIFLCTAGDATSTASW